MGPKRVLKVTSSIGKAKRLFAASKYFSLPVVDKDKVLIGVIKIKDIMNIADDKKIEPYISKDYIVIQRPTVNQDLTEVYYENSESYTEIYITDFDGKFVDLMSMHAFVKNKALTSEIMNEEQFLRQIVRPTSLARCILDDLNDGVILVDKNSLILYANQAYGHTLGVPVNKIIGRYLSKVEPEAKILDVIKTGEHMVSKIIKIKSLGIIISANITPIKYKNQIVGAISVFTDITTANRIAAEMEHMDIFNKLLAQEIESDYVVPEAFKNIVGSSSKLRKQINFAAKVALIESPVLILGESGTGKELVARAIHEGSSRKDGPFISINCAAIPESLLESELFGYEEGAFTGAKKGGKIGKFQQADQGTLFLDEIGDMPLQMQTKLLRFLQDKEVVKVGGVKPVKVDIRLISATNKNVVEMIANKNFREDLFYRINVFTITLPPLRERRIDIYNLIKYYKTYYEEKYKKKVIMTAGCTRFLLDYNWPGNVRELKNVLEHLVVMSNDHITVENLPEYLKQEGTEVKAQEETNEEAQSLFDKLKEAEKRAILDALLETNNNKSQAIKLLKISRRTFYKKLKEFNL